MGAGAGLSTDFRFTDTAKPIADCEAQRARADAPASVSTARRQLEQTPCAAATSSAEAQASENAPRALSAEGHRRITTRATPKGRATHPVDAPPDGGAPPPAPGPDLHAALQLLRAAQQALKAADAKRALSLLDEMARRAPEVLALEREVTRTLAYCAARDVDAARRTAAALRDSAVASVYAHRLSKSCVGPAPAPATLLREMRRRALN
jgi:hypothetical protein